MRILHEEGRSNRYKVVVQDVVVKLWKEADIGGRCDVGRTRKIIWMETMDVPTLGAAQQIDTVEECGEFEEAGHLGPTGLRERPTTAHQVNAVAQCEECAEGASCTPSAREERGGWASCALSLGTPSPWQAATDAGATQVAQLLTEMAATEMEGDPEQINLA